MPSPFDVLDRERLDLELDRMRHLGLSVPEMARRLTGYVRDRLDAGREEPRAVTPALVSSGLERLRARDQARAEAGTLDMDPDRMRAQQTELLVKVQERAWAKLNPAQDPAACPECGAALPLSLRPGAPGPGEGDGAQYKAIIEANKRLAKMQGLDAPAQINITGQADQGLKEALLLILSAVQGLYGEDWAESVALAAADAIEASRPMALNPSLRSKAEALLPGPHTPMFPETAPTVSSIKALARQPNTPDNGA